MTVRHAIPTDAMAIAEIQVATWQKAYRGQVPDGILDSLDIGHGTRMWADVLSTQHDVLGAFQDSNLLGFCSLVPCRDSDTDPREVAEIAALYIDSVYWRRGVGRALCNHALAIADARKFSNVTLWVLASNIAAIGFYQAM